MHTDYNLDKEAGPRDFIRRNIGPIKAKAPAGLYSKYVEAFPAGEAALLGGAGALAGYHGGGLITSTLLKTILVGKSPAEQAEIMARLKKDGTVGLIKMLTGIAGGALGAGYAINKHIDTSRGAEGAVGSMFDPEYKEKHPEYLKRQWEDAKEMAKNTKYNRKALGVPAYTSGRNEPMQKLNSLLKEAYGGEVTGFSDPFHKQNIPIQYSMDLVNNDPFLSIPEKDATNMIIEGAEDSTSGLASGRSFMRSAIHAGVGYGTGYVFGQMASKVLSLPPTVTKRLSTSGGIAGAITNTGILGKIL